MPVIDDITRLYEEKLGRKPDANEIATGTENFGKYGIDQLKTELERRAEPTLSNGGRGGDADLDYDAKPDAGWTRNERGDLVFGGTQQTRDANAAAGRTAEAARSTDNRTPSSPATPTTPTAAATATAPTADYSSREARLKQLYQWFLGRDATDEEIQGHLARYAGGNFDETFIRTFLQSPEYQERQPAEVQRLYRTLLGRDPTPEEVAAHAGNPQGFAGIEYAIRNSAEYKGRNPGAPATPPPTTTAPPAPPRPPASPTSTVAPPTGPFGPSSNPFPDYRGGAFTDPASNFAEQTALTRFGQRTAPAPGSGTAMYESFAKSFAAMLQADPFTDSEEAAMRTKAFEKLSQMKQQEIEAKKAELAQRRISDKSGVYISEMNRIRDKYDRLRASNENELLVTAIGERQRRMTQSFSVLASLMASEEGRMDAALSLAMIPLQLQDQAFQRLVTASNMGGDLSGVTNNLMQLLNMATNSRLYNESQQSSAIDALGQFIGQYWL